MALIESYLYEYLENLQYELNEDLARIQKEAVKDNVPIIRNQTLGLIGFLLTLVRPKRILEIGTAVGFSASFMSQYLQQGGTITTIERYEPMIKKAKLNIKELNLEEKIKLLEGDADLILKELVREREKFDVVFMDAAKGQYIKILPYVYSLLNVGGIIIADDVLQDGTVAKNKCDVVKRQRTIHHRLNDFLKEITSNEALKTTILTVSDGVSLSYKIKEI